MTTRILAYRSYLRRSYNMLSDNIGQNYKKLQEKLVLPERLRGTMVEKWRQYWKQLSIDYVEVVKDTGKHMKDHPLKTSIYGTIGGSIYFMGRHNPSEADFLDEFRRYNGEMILVSEACLNPVSAQHINYIQECYNAGIVRLLNLGIVSLLWLDNFDSDVATYKSTCGYLKPDWLHFHERVIDVGFMDRWWILDKKMIDYDVNF